MLNTWYTDYEIAGRKYWKCGRCQNLIPFSDNNMNFCGHCGEPKRYYTTEHREAELRRQLEKQLQSQGNNYTPM